MNSQKQTAKAIEQEAAAWAARCDARALSFDDQAALDDWLSGDIRRLGAFARARAALLLVDDVEALAQPQTSMWTAPATRRWLVAASVAGLTGSLILLAQSRPLAAKPRRFVSEIGEVRVIPLEDGTRITMSTNSALTVDFQPGRRLVRLLRGEAYFEVAKNRERPFVVIGPRAQARAVGTAYSVRLVDADQMKVLVTEGVVSIEKPQPSARGPFAALWGSTDRVDNLVGVEAGEEATVSLVGSDAGTDSGRVLVSVASVSHDAAQRALAWRDGRLSFEGQTLAAAAAEFAQFSPRRILIKDEALGREHISGLFAATDPVGFSRAAALALNAKMKLKNNTIVLYR